MITDFGSHSIIFGSLFDNRQVPASGKAAICSSQFLSELLADIDSSGKSCLKKDIERSPAAAGCDITDDSVVEQSRRENTVEIISAQLYEFFAQGRADDYAPSAYIRRHNRLIDYIKRLF